MALSRSIGLVYFVAPSEESLSDGEAAGAVIGGTLVLALLWLIIRSCGNHRMGRVDPKQAINAAMANAVVRHAAVSTKPISALPTGLPQIKIPGRDPSYVREDFELCMVCMHEFTSFCGRAVGI